MTRDEAIKIWDANPNDFLEPPDIIDKFAALGMLKLDEPKSGLDKLKSRLVGDFGYSHSSTAIKDLESALRAANLKIVEK